MKALFLSIFLLVFGSVSSGAQEQQPIKGILQQQCQEAGGSFSGVCHCNSQENVLAITAQAVAAVQKKKINSKTLSIINPFAETCKPSISLNPDKTKERLAQLLIFDYNVFTKNPDLATETQALLKVNILRADNMVRYVLDADYKKSTFERLNTMKDQVILSKEKWVDFSYKQVADTARTKAKQAVIANLSETIGIDITLAQKVMEAIKSQMSQEATSGVLQKMTKEEALSFLKSLGGRSVTIGKSFAVSALKGVKSGVMGVVRGVAIDAIAAMTGLKLDWTQYLDPVNLLIVTVQPQPAQASTVSSDLAANPMRAFDFTNRQIPTSMNAYCESMAQFMFTAGENKSYDDFTSSVAMMSLYLEARQASQQPVSVASLLVDEE